LCTKENDDAKDDDDSCVPYEARFVFLEENEAQVDQNVAKFSLIATPSS